MAFADIVLRDNGASVFDIDLGGGGGGGSIKSVSGVLFANIKSVSGVLKANIKTVSGVSST